MTVLIVDDSAEIRDLVKRLFRDDTVHECGSIPNALAMYSRYRPDWVFMDLKMGDVDGVRATRAITHDFPEARVIIVTQFSDTFTRALALAAGAMGVVQKEDMYRLPDIVCSGSSSTGQTRTGAASVDERTPTDTSW